MKKLLLAALLSAASLAHAGDFGINLYGASYHLDRERARRIGVDNEWNPGLGLRYQAPINPRFDWFADGGAYEDSGRNTALYAGAGAFWKVSGGWRLGGALAAFDSDTYNRGRSFIAPVPMAAYEWRRATLNMVYLPRIGELNEVAALGFWLTVWLR